MAKVKVHRSTPTIDMTPMVDLAFLLVTFFMLTATAIPDEPVAVDTPSSVSKFQIPENNVLTITIGKDDKVFFNMDGQYNRKALLDVMGGIYNISFTDEESTRFARLSSVGMPMGNMKQYLDMTPEERKAIQHPGIPVDSVNNELKDWILQARLINRQLRIAIKGDQNASYEVARKVMNTLIDRKVNRFNLITNIEGAPAAE
jgi:biopolymer transport protein ExbD